MDEKTKRKMNDALRSFYFNTVKPALPNLNERRKERLFAMSYVLFWITFLTLVIVSLRSGLHSASYLLFGVAVVAAFCIPRNFLLTLSLMGTLTKGKVFDISGEEEIKSIFMPGFLHIFGKLKWQKGYSGNSVEAYRFYKSLNIMPPSKFLSFDDMIYGTYSDVNLNILETKYAGFSGVFIEFEMNKNFEGHTFILEKNATNNIIKFDRSMFKEVKLEDPEFSAKYVVYSNNQIEARYILTTAFMQRFKNIKTAFKAKYMRAAFKDGKIVMALNVGKDLFSMGNILKDSNNKTFTELFDEILFVLEMIDELKLNQNLGL